MSALAVAVAALAVLSTGCATEAANNVELGELLPDSNEVLTILAPDLLKGDETAIEEYVRPGESKGFGPNRDGPVGGRAFAVGGELMLGPELNVDEYLFKRSSPEEAREFWEKRPPEVAHVDTAMNLSPPPEGLDDLLVDWRSDVVVPAADSPVDAICLAGPYDFGCVDFRIWFTLCNYAVELQLQPTDGWPIGDPRASRIAADFAASIADRIGCDD